MNIEIDEKGRLYITPCLHKVTANKVGFFLRSFYNFAHMAKHASRIEFACRENIPAFWFFKRSFWCPWAESVIGTQTFPPQTNEWAGRVQHLSEQRLKASIVDAGRYRREAVILEVARPPLVGRLWEIYVRLSSQRI
ncbi:MAG: hypothetical protein WD003_02095 [Candidatus Paceibacterota bacterium]